MILDELRTGEGQISRWPTDDELRDRLLDADIYGYVAQARIAMVLAAVETSLYIEQGRGAVRSRSELSIEHVMPQTWEENWPLAGRG